MTNENITHLVDKAHLILNARTIDAAFISTIATSTLSGSVRGYTIVSKSTET